MAGSSYSTSSSTGSSTSNPVQTPQSSWGLQLSQLLTALGNNQYSWAMDQYNTGKGITYDNINTYMNLAGQGAGLAQNLLSRYENVFEPLMDQYIQQAGTYSSEARQRFMMGQAESTVAQSDQAARDNAERNLQSYGINPNSGRYQDLMLTSRIQDAAARAGAGTQAALNTANTGREMLKNAAQMGQNVPGMTVNALNSAYTGVTGAENSILGLLNAGSSLSQSANPYYSTASSAIKQPSQESASTQASKGQSSSVNTTGSVSNNGNNRNNRNNGNYGNNRNTGSGNQGSSSGSQTGSGPKSIQNPYYNANQPNAKMYGNGNNNNTGTGNGTGQDDESPYVDSSGNIQPYFSPSVGYDETGTMSTPETAPWDNSTDATGMPQANNLPPYDYANQPSFNFGSDPGQFNVDQNASSWNPATSQTPQPTDQSNPFGSPDSNPYWNSSAADNGSGTTQAQDQSGASQDNGSYWNNFASNWGNENNFDNYQQDYQPSSNDFGSNDFGSNDFGSNDYQDQGSSSFDEGGFGSTDWGSYARGGRVQQRGVLPTTGGHVPRGASPSQGRMTDDVPARLNAGEFVVPRDVVAHKGTEFFQNLINKSRKLRTGMGGAPAQGRMKPALPNMHQPTFVSRRMGA